MSGIYWGLTAMHLLGRLHEMDGEAVLGWVKSCQHANGGFGGSARNDPHLLYTLSALQILALYDRLHEVDADKVMACEPTGAASASLVAWFGNQHVGRTTCACDACLRGHLPLCWRRRQVAAAARRVVCQRRLGRGGHALQLLRAAGRLHPGPAARAGRAGGRALCGGVQEL